MIIKTVAGAIGGESGRGTGQSIRVRNGDLAELLVTKPHSATLHIVMLPLCPT